MPRALLLALALGGLSALAQMAVLLGGAGGLILALLSSLPLFYAGLTGGIAAVLVASAAGTAISLTLGLWPAVGYALQVALAPVLLTRWALLFRAGPDQDTEWYPVGHLFGLLTAVAAAGLVLAHLWFIGAENGLLGHLRADMLSRLEQMHAQGSFGQLQVKPEDLAAMAQGMAVLIPGVAAGVWTSLMVGNGLLAQGLALRFGKAIRPGSPLSTMELPGWIGPALAVSLAVSFLGGPTAQIGTGLSILLIVPFAFQGLAVVHVLARRTSFPGLVLGMVYALIIVFGVPIGFIIMLGLFEQWIRLRRRLVSPGG